MRNYIGGVPLAKVVCRWGEEDNHLETFLVDCDCLLSPEAIAQMFSILRVNAVGEKPDESASRDEWDKFESFEIVSISSDIEGDPRFVDVFPE